MKTRFVGRRFEKQRFGERQGRGENCNFAKAGGGDYWRRGVENIDYWRWGVGNSDYCRRRNLWVISLDLKKHNREIIWVFQKNLKSPNSFRKLGFSKK